MRFAIIRELFLKEVRETLRDRRSLLLMFGIPLLLYPLLTLGIAGITASAQRKQKAQPTRLAVVNPEAAPHLMARIRDSASEFRLVTPKDARAELASGKIDAVLVLPARCETDVLSARKTEIRIRLDRSRSTAGLTGRRLDELMREYEEWVIGQRLKARGLPASLVRELSVVTDDTATANQRMGRLLALTLPMILLFTGMLGAFGPAVNAITSERESGTLETLLVTPARKIELLLAKGALVLLACLTTAAINLLSMSLVLWRTVSMAGPGGPRAANAFTLDAGSLALTFLAAVPTLIFFTGTILVVVLAARNYREANAYASILFLLPMAPMLVQMTEPKTTPALLLTPMVNTAVIIRDVLTDRATPGAFVMAFASSALYATLALVLAARLFSTEDLVNTSWEPLSLKGLRQGLRRRERRLPTVDEALALFAISLLLLVYISPAFFRWGFIGIVAGNELLLIAAPTLLFAALMRYRWRETFAWRRTTVGEVVGAALIGVGVLPWVYALAALQERYWKSDPEFARATMKLLFPALQAHPIATALVVGILAGVCEELLYRGPLQTALARRLPAALALGIGAFLFAAAHLDPYGLLFRTGIGVLLGWIVLRGGSIFPAMVMHAVADATHFGLFAWTIHTFGRQNSTNHFEIAARFTAAFAGSWWAWLAIGTALLLLGGWLCVTAWRRRALARQSAALEAQPLAGESTA